MDENDLNDFTINSLDEKSKKIDLLRQELDVNFQEQVLVKKRIALINETFKNMPSTDPEYAIFFTQREMDQIHLDELKSRENALKSKVNLYS
ncbi:MAG: hypothetical protein K940chlam1_00934 [Candidatus Anoxychlamydiales bacterium]|nr:hypothetical protein [Candidatus Anoxychlamydiales bacterium]NGX35440.1 hypothetical protein [Candidatus Anoxychlamydiales bacterium]